jgi:hypothetical protein
MDLDGDGLERIMLDDNLHVSSCLDGEGEVLASPDCWQDPRMADGFSVCGRLDGSRVQLAGPHPAWQYESGSDCRRFPAETSIWGGCVAELCERWSSQACVPACGGEGAEACQFDCAGYGTCRPAGVRSWALTTCAAGIFEGAAWCSGDPQSVLLADGWGQARGFFLAEPVTVGQGPLVVEARASVSLVAEGEQPGYGFSVVAYVDRAYGRWFDSEGHCGVPGFNPAEAGYAAEWHFWSDDERDQVALRVADASGACGREHWIGDILAPIVEPALDSDAAGPLEQTLRLAIYPDMPETETSELLVSAQVFARGAWSQGPACRGAACPVEVRPGDRLRVGMVAATDDLRARVEMTGPDAFVVRADGSCP